MTETFGVRGPAVCLLALAAAVSGKAEAVMLEPGGLGQVLLFPYYTTRGGNDTLISIVNTAAHGKAVKLRFLESRNGRPVLDFHLYLGAYDVWTAALGHMRGDAGEQLGSGLLTRDRSCTVPDIMRGGLGYELTDLYRLPDGTHFVSFSNAAFSGIAQDHDDSMVGTMSGLDRTREGYIEVIEMAAIEPDSQLHSWITHTGAGTPSDCLALNRAWFEDDGAFVQDPTFGLMAPDGRGQLLGNAMIVNPARGTAFGYAADALSEFNHRILHEAPGASEPGLHSVNDPGPEGATKATAKIARGGRSLEVTYVEDGEFGRIDAISALYATPRVINEYYLEHDVVIAASEWVMTFPTRRYYVDNKPALPSGQPFTPLAGGARAPFSFLFGSEGACSPFSTYLLDRGQRHPFPIRWGPTPPVPRVCWQTQVLSFGQRENQVVGVPTEILGATSFVEVGYLPDHYIHGWVWVEFLGEPALRPSLQGVTIQGLPVTGFFVVNYDNPDLTGGVLANYSALFRHRTELACTGSEAC